MTINLSSTAMPLIFGAAGTVVGPALLFWLVGASHGAGAWLATGLQEPRGTAPTGPDVEGGSPATGPLREGDDSGRSR